jgi:hypothetical protein
MFDERAPEDPSRRRGLAPSCAKCDAGGGAVGRYVDSTGNTGAVEAGAYTHPLLSSN